MRDKARVQVFRQAIADFIQSRRDEKLKGKSDDATLMRKYDYAVWLEDAARRVGQIYAATHISKAIHSSAKASNLYVTPDNLPQRNEIGSHLLGNDFEIDVVGNAAALDVFKFLKTKVEGKPLLAWAEAGDPDFKVALSEDPVQADSWSAAFAGLLSSNQKTQSHSLMKQIYWLTGEQPSEDEQYILLQPLFPSALVHYVHQHIQEIRFGENNKAARSAFYKKQSSELVYRDYKNLAVRKLGGTKPQNVSQLNSERGGVNYLLASLPPLWKSKRRLIPLNARSALDVFFRQKNVVFIIDMLVEFLKAKQNDNNHHIRGNREKWVQRLVALLADFAATVKVEMPVGWSRDMNCQIPDYEKLWLDSERSLLHPREDFIEIDQNFYDAYMKGDWPDEVAQNFGRRLNDKLRDSSITIGDDEYKYWVKQVIIDVAWPIPQRRKA